MEKEMYGFRIKAFRVSIGETQGDLARILGVSQSKIAKIEDGLGGLTLDDAANFYKIFGLDIYWLITGCGPIENRIRAKIEIDYEFLEMQADKFVKT